MYQKTKKTNYIGILLRKNNEKRISYKIYEKDFLFKSILTI